MRIDNGAGSFPRADLSSYYNLAGHGRNVAGMLPGSLKAEYPIGETPCQATMFVTPRSQNTHLVTYSDFFDHIF